MVPVFVPIAGISTNTLLLTTEKWTEETSPEPEETKPEKTDGKFLNVNF